MSLQVPGPALLSDNTTGSPAGTSPVGTSGITATQVAYGDTTANTIKGSALLTFTEASGVLNLSGTGSAPTGLLNFATGTTRNVGIGFSTDTFLYRNAAGQVSLDAPTGDVAFILKKNGVTAGYLSTNGSAVQLASQSGQVLILSNNITALTLDGSQNANFAQNVTLAGTALLTKPGGVIPLITTNTAITDQAGASIGTLNNAPSAGNPSKWILINDNGTTRKIPTWT